MDHPSIFNDVLSPVTPGPSSSNTCGPYRIGRIGRQLLGEAPTRLTIRMAKDGGYADTFYGMQSDLAFLAGFMAKELLSYDLTRAYDDASAAGLSFSFDFVSDMPTEPSELADIQVLGANHSLRMTATSLGGGEIVITELNGQPVLLDGKQAASVSCGSYTASVDPVFPFSPLEHAAPPFTTAKELMAYVMGEGISLWQAALRYERALTGADEETLYSYAESLYELSLASIEAGLSPNNHFTGVTTEKACEYAHALEHGQLFSLGMADRGCLDAMAIMEHSNGHGLIACMPTGGSSGIIPAAIKNAAIELALPKQDCIRALLVAGLIGLFYYPTHYTGALGCQAEIGVAVSMAAAALTSLKTDDPRIIEKAASMGGQSVMGMICNPVNGFVQTPCILRNMTAVPTAVTCANAALAGMDAIVPLDEVVQRMLAVGKQIRPCNRAGTYNVPE